MLEFRLGQENLLKKVIESIKDLVYQANFDCDSYGLTIQGLDPKREALASLYLCSDDFNFYHNEYDFSMGIDFDNLAKMLQCAGTDDIVTINDDYDGGYATFMFQSPDKDNMTSEFKMKLIDTEPNLQVPEVEYDAIVQMPSSEFARICKYLSTIGDIGVISVTKKGLKFSTKGDTGTASIVCRQSKSVDKPEEAIIIKMKSPVSLTCRLRYLNLFTNATPLASQVTLRLASENPVVVEYEIPEIGYLRFYLAPIPPKDKEDEKMGSHHPKRVVAKKQQEDKNMARPMKLSKTS